MPPPSVHRIVASVALASMFVSCIVANLLTFKMVEQVNEKLLRDRGFTLFSGICLNFYGFIANTGGYILMGDSP